MLSKKNPTSLTSQPSLATKRQLFPSQYLPPPKYVPEWRLRMPGFTPQKLAHWEISPVTPVMSRSSQRSWKHQGQILVEMLGHFNTLQILNKQLHPLLKYEEEEEKLLVSNNIHRLIYFQLFTYLCSKQCSKAQADSADKISSSILMRNCQFVVYLVSQNGQCYASMTPIIIQSFPWILDFGTNECSVVLFISLW